MGADLPGRDHARQLAQDELSRRQYEQAKPPLFLRLLRAVIDKLDEVLSQASASLPGGWVGLVVLLLVVVGLAALVIVRLRPSTNRGAFHQELFGDQVLTAQEHRLRAERAAGSGQYDEAVRERLRAVVRELEARGVLDPRPGRTADEVAREAGAVVPAVAEPLRLGTTTFDEVWYGGRTATRASYEVLVEVDRTVTETRLARA